MSSVRQSRDVSASVRWLLEVSTWDREAAMRTIVMAQVALHAPEVPSNNVSHAIDSLLSEVYRTVQPKDPRE